MRKIKLKSIRLKSDIQRTRELLEAMESSAKNLTEARRMEEAAFEVAKNYIGALPELENRNAVIDMLKIRIADLVLKHKDEKP